MQIFIAKICRKEQIFPLKTKKLRNTETKIAAAILKNQKLEIKNRFNKNERTQWCCFCGGDFSGLGSLCKKVYLCSLN